MPHKKGRARNTVPQQYNRTSKKATRTCKDGFSLESFSLACHSHPAVNISSGDEESLLVPSDVWLRIMTFARAIELCRLEALNKATNHVLAQEGSTTWEFLCQLNFPTMWSSIKESEGVLSHAHIARSSQQAPQEPTSVVSTAQLDTPTFKTTCVEMDDASRSSILQDKHCEATAPPESEWKFLYARRYLKQRQWDTSRGRSRSLPETETSKTSSVGRICLACGERFTSARESTCISHPGEFLPRSLSVKSPDDSSREWSKAELSQLQQLARAAWRSVGGSSGVCRNARNYKGGGHWAKYMGFKGWGSRGHWAEGCGPRPGSALLRDCIDGKIQCSWSCCDSEELISKGCLVGIHK